MCKTQLVGTCYKARKLTLVLCDDREGWDGEGWRGDPRGRGYAHTYSLFTLLNSRN